ncbi:MULTISPECIES: ABC transporter ATP-binding protein [Salinibaculum]|uniref:ABC transporter ATP-binding protein n=1 Tax=Salinibaculum TaxID=2732368 RepID=UPI0030D1D0B2
MPNIDDDTEPDDSDVTTPRGRLAADGGSDDLPEGVVLRATDVAKTYDSPLPFGRTVEVLDSADLELGAGEIVGIVGENGSGKSTLMKVLVGALEADAGQVERSGAAGWCPQDPLLYDRLTVSETFDLFGRAYGMDAEEIAEARERLADRLDFERFLDYRVDHLSGGNRQKVNLGVALMHDPDVLLLDEPYTGFDWETYLAFWDLTEELTDRGTAIAIISHFVSERERFDRIYELRDGRLHEQDAVAPETPDDAGVQGGHGDSRTDGQRPPDAEVTPE